MFILNGKPLPVDTPFQVRGTQYPANWLRLSTSAEKTAIGITEVEDPIRPDDRFYWVSQNEDGTFTSIPKALDDKAEEDGSTTKGLKSQFVDQIKTTAGSLLAQTSWMIERSVDPSSMKPVASDVLEARAAIRDKSNLFEEAIMSADTVEELITVLNTINWE